MTVGSLFSGIGGLDLGFEAAGFDVRWFCEADLFCRKVLAKHWPGVPCYPDIRQLRAADVEPVDVLIGGFPCQDVSDAGKREGLTDTNRSGLWSEYARLVREFRALGLRGVAVENVPGLFVRGFDTVLADLAALGFDAEWSVLRAADVGAPHRRARVFVLAYPRGRGFQDVERRELHAERAKRRELDSTQLERPANTGSPRGVAVTDSGRQREPDIERHTPRLSAGVADAAGARSTPGQPGKSGPLRHEARGAEPERRSGAGLADASSGGGRQRLREGEPRGERRRRPSDDDQPAGAGLVDATVAGPQGHQPEAGDGGIHGEHLRSDARASAERDPFWPARPGEPQHAWEPPRCLKSSVGAGADGVPGDVARRRLVATLTETQEPPVKPGWRRAALTATGNAVVPQVAEVVAWRLRAILEER